MATTLHTPVRFTRTRPTTSSARAVRTRSRALDLMLAGVMALLTVPWFLFSRLMRPDDLDALFANEGFDATDR